VSFDVPADAYDRFMGRYSNGLSVPFADFADVLAGQRVLDVGCGPGALTTELVRRLGAAGVAAVDPSASFVASARLRHPGVTVEEASAESLPFRSGELDAALAQLVVHLMTDPVAGLTEMARVTRPGGVVAACVWDYGEARDPLRIYWRAARKADLALVDESHLPGVRRGHRGELLRTSGLVDIAQGELTVTVEHTGFEDWWEPFTFGVGPAGAHYARLSATQQVEQRERCRALVPDGPFALTATAWAARGAVPGE